MCLEIMLLAVNLNLVMFSIFLDDMAGQILALMVLTVAAAETSIGLAILVAYYKCRGSISVIEFPTLRK
jgi:NADH-quinone oxidoreductase subunit K